MKIEIRKCIEYTIQAATESVSLDMDDFRKLSTPFNGESEKEFLDYLKHGFDWEDEGLEQLSLETLEKIAMLFDCPDYEETHNSSINGEIGWFESGQKMDDYFEKEYNNFE